LKKLLLIYIKAYDFPLGGAPQNRALGILKALRLADFDIAAHVFGPSKLDISQNHINKQIYDFIPIENHAWRWSPVKNKIFQLVAVVEGYTRLVFALLKKYNNSNIDFIIFNSENLFYIFPIFIFCKIFRIKLGRDLNEYPKHIIKSDSFNLKLKFWDKLNYKLFDFLFIMTNPLIEFYKPLARKNSKILHLPMTVDIDRFIQNSNIPKENHITYCGDLSQKKDGVIDLIEAFYFVQQKYADYKLKLIGTNSNKVYMEKLLKLIGSKKLNDKVILTGFLPPEQVVKELKNSSLLVLSRPDNIQAQGGFPTKLGEYLATGVPVVITSVGDIPFYLIHKKNAYLAKPGNIMSFSKEIINALKNEKYSLKVGKEGQQTAMFFFSHLAQSRLLSNFLRGIK